MNKRIVSLATLLSVFLLPAIAFAAEGAEHAGPNDGWYAIAIMFGMGIAAFGCGTGQGRAAASALEGICRNPNAANKAFTPMILALVFPETLVLFTLLAAFLIYGKFGI